MPAAINFIGGPVNGSDCNGTRKRDAYTVCSRAPYTRIKSAFLCYESIGDLSAIPPQICGPNRSVLRFEIQKNSLGLVNTASARLCRSFHFRLATLCQP